SGRGRMGAGAAAEQPRVREFGARTLAAWPPGVAPRAGTAALARGRAAVRAGRALALPAPHCGGGTARGAGAGKPRSDGGVVGRRPVSRPPGAAHSLAGRAAAVD